MALKKFLTKAFYDVDSRLFLWTNDILAALTLISVLSIILETTSFAAPYTAIFSWVEYTTVTCFTLEYLGRIVAAKRDPLAYVFSFFGAIDLLSVAPTYLGLANLTFLKTARVLRILRLLRIIRLAKITRLTGQKRRDLEEYGSVYRLNIQIYFAALAAAVIIFGTLIFIVEPSNHAFSSIPLGMLWALKPLLGGVAQEMPTTAIGELIAIVTRFVGLILFGLLIAVIGNATKKLLLGDERPARGPVR